VAGLSADCVRRNLEEVRDEIAAVAGGREVRVLAAVKYLPVEDLDALAAGGVTVVGENRAQELELKSAAHPELEWHFIGHLQSRKVKQVLPLVKWVHSVSTDSTLAQLERHGTPDTEVLVEVNVAREEGKGGVDPDELDAFLERCPVKVVGLMTMPPFTEQAQDSRHWFTALRELAEARGLPELSMGTTQDYVVAVEEGATIVRIGTRLYR
jgi:PLP dependent protein